MDKVLLVFDSENFLEEFLKTATELGFKFERRNKLILVGRNISDDELATIFYEVNMEVLKHLKLYKGDFDERDCESLLETLPKVKSVEDFFDEFLFKNIGKLLINTKILFHPIISVEKKSVWAVEALCRPPVHIIDLLTVGKKSSQFSEMYCRDKALEKFSHLGINNLYLFLNFHPKFLKDPLENFGDFISSVYLYNLKPEKIVVELTEHEAVEIKVIKNLISYLKSEKVKVALDDIGTGYSGLFYLSELKPDIIKIDMELVRDIHKHNLKKVIVNYLIRMAHDNGIKVVAEGVEKIEELETVVYIGVDFIQGFLFSKPVENPNICEINEKVKRLLSSIS